MTHWNNQANKWNLIGPPLKPSAVDIQNHHKIIHPLIQEKSCLSVLVLGVTPELIMMKWPGNTGLFAVDNNLKMIESVLPTAVSNIKPIGIAGDWLQLPLPSSSIDLAIGDGCYSVLNAKDYSQVTSELHRVLKTDGKLILRFYSRPQKNESMEDIQTETWHNRQSSFHAFKLRLAMSLHNELHEGVRLGNVWDYWDKHFRKNIHENKHQWNWPEEVINTIDNYKDMDVYYTFPTASEIRSTFNQHFVEQAISFPDYYLGNCCPSITFTRKGNT